MWLTYHWQDSESCETELKRSDEILSAGLIVTDGCEHDGRGRVSRIELITVSLNVTSHNGHTHPPVLSIESLRLSSQHNSKLIANIIANISQIANCLTSPPLITVLSLNFPSPSLRLFLMNTTSQIVPAS